MNQNIVICLRLADQLFAAALMIICTYIPRFMIIPYATCDIKVFILTSFFVLNKSTYNSEKIGSISVSGNAKSTEICHMWHLSSVAKRLNDIRCQTRSQTANVVVLLNCIYLLFTSHY